MRDKLFALIVFAFVAQAFAANRVVLITVDTFRSDYLGPATPNIQRLAKSGIYFPNTVSPVPLTLPAHCSIMTGLLPIRHGVHDNSGFVLNSKITTLAQIFHNSGFLTAAFIGAFPLDSRFGLDRGFDVYDDSYPVVNQHSEITMPERNAETVGAARGRSAGSTRRR